MQEQRIVFLKWIMEIRIRKGYIIKVVAQKIKYTINYNLMLILEDEIECN